MDNISARIFRHEPPTKNDTAPCGTECKVEGKKYFEIYLQISSNEEAPRWILIGEYPNDISPDLANEIIQADIHDMIGH